MTAMTAIAINKSRTDVGLAGVRYAGDIPVDRKLKVSTRKDGYPDYNYVIQSNETVFYPLTCGNGTYAIKLLKQTEPESNKYSVLMTDSVTLNLADQDTVYAQSCVNMPWNPDMGCIKFAKDITQRMNEVYKAETLWRHIIDNYHYDLELANRVYTGEIKYQWAPDIEKIFREQKGVCFDLTALYNSMLRSVGIRAKMVHGPVSPNNIYHAWSEVYIDGKWQLVDVTFDSGRKDAVFLRQYEKMKYEVKFYY